MVVVDGKMWGWGDGGMGDGDDVGIWGSGDGGIVPIPHTPITPTHILLHLLYQR